MKLVFCIFLFITFQTMAKQLSEMSWKKRLLIVSYNQKEDQLLTRAKEFIFINKCELEDRNLEIIFYDKFKNKKFTTPKFLENKYGIWLIGYDGNIKDYSSDDKIFFRLFNLIDSMPMRKSEIEKDTC